MRMLFVYISTALKQLFVNKGRSVLTMLGIIVGIGSVICIMTLGEISKQFLLDQISQFGTNVLEVTVPGILSEGESEIARLTESDVELLQNSSLLPEIKAVSAGYSISETVQVEDIQTMVSVVGDRPDYFSINNINVKKGRLYTSADVEAASRVVVIDEKTAKDMFGRVDVVGERMKIGGNFFTVIGVIDEGLFGPGNFGFSMVYVPITTVKQLFVDSTESEIVSFMMIEFEQGTNADSLKSRVDYELRRNHGLLKQQGEPFLYVSREQAIGIVNTVLLGIQAFITAVAAISLIVGGIGIMNIMLVTVKERTKEIGLRKAIGAKNRSILIQFLIESVVLTTVGGIIGIITGLGITLAAVLIVNSVQPDWTIHFIFVPKALIIACAVSVSVGIIFGLYPAIKASKLHPIEALRYE